MPTYGPLAMQSKCYLPVSALSHHVLIEVQYVFWQHIRYYIVQFVENYLFIILATNTLHYLLCFFHVKGKINLNIVKHYFICLAQFVISLGFV